MALSFFGRMNGCKMCNSGYTRVQGKPHTLCVSSTYIQQNTYITTTKYIKNCQSYNPAGSSSDLVCKVCLSGYIPNDTYKACAAQTSYPNCSLYSSASPQCATCNTNYVLISGLCNLMNIANCKDHQTTGITRVQCQTCNPGFVLSTDYTACTAGLVANCSTYPQGQSAICSTCLLGFTLLSTVSNGYYCY